MHSVQSTNTNVDQHEIARFNALASRWWDENSEFRPLHRINPHRLEWIDQLTSLNGKKVIDIGCGGGILAEAMAKRGAQVCGIDLAGKPLEIARWHAAQVDVKLEYADSSAEEWATKHHQHYDVITCMEMLEHVPDPSSVIAACSSMLKPGGWCFFSTINRNPLAYLTTIIGAEYVLRTLPIGTHHYHKFIRPHELIQMAENCGLQLIEKKGLGYNPITQNFRLIRFTGMAYLLAMKKV